MAKHTGSIVNGYAIGDPIGEGGQGIVYKGVHVETDKTVAVKVMLAHDLGDEKLAQRIALEAEIMRELRHPNVIHFENFWEDENGIWLVMRWLPGGNLRNYIAQHKPLPLERIAQIMDDVAAALDAAHEAGIIHRDIKPDNILFDDTGRAYLTDFGVAKKLGYQAITSFGVVMGSPAYLTPEQILGQPLATQTDVYALGITLYEMLTAEHPFMAAKGQIQLMLMLAQADLPAVHQLRPDISETVTQVIAQATSRTIEQRYETVSAFAQAYRAAIC